MQEDPTTGETEIAPIEAEAWNIAFEPYSEHPTTAYGLARVLMAVKQLLQTKPPHVSIAATSLDEACESLFAFTQFREAGYDLFRTVIEGRATTAHEDLLDSLGIKY
jgi:hypothetical protein